MTRSILRLLAMVALAVAVIMAVLDATRSIAAETPVATPLAASWAALSPQTLAGFESLVSRNLSPYLWDPVMLAMLSLPGFVVFAGLALLLSAAGRPPRHRDRFVAGR